MNDTPDLLLIGCGTMGRALAVRYHAGLPGARLVIVDPNLDQVRAGLPSDGRIEVVARVDGLVAIRPGLTVVAVKPQTMAALLPGVAALAAARGLVVSVAAGVAAATLQAALPQARIVRAMPNTPALVGKGVTALWSSPGATQEDRSACEVLFGAVGQTIWVPLEADIDAVTAVSGSGPAYLIAVVEAMAKAGADAGLGAATAEFLARATLVGAAAMMQEQGGTLAGLKAAVRSAGGTTDAALRVFEDGDRLAHLIGCAVAAAHRRAIEISRVSGAWERAELPGLART